MEDISRELEKELKAHSRPVPVKRKIKTELYFIDDIGKIASAAWIRPLVGLLAILTFFSTATAGVFVYLYTTSGAEQSELTRRLFAQEKRVQQLVGEKEILMARLVLSGNDSAIAAGGVPTDTPVTDDGKTVSKKASEPVTTVAAVKQEQLLKQKKIKADKKKADKLKADKLKADKKRADKKKADKLKADKLKADKKKADKLKADKKRADKLKAESTVKAVKSPLGKVGVEGLRVVNDGNNGDLLVRFNIRNTSVDSKNISGYVFVILKPDAEHRGDWMVVPTVAIDKGKPAIYRKGQYFSIAHFKPVNFRVKSHSAPDSFKIATVFVYDDEGGLMLRRDMPLAQSKG